MKRQIYPLIARSTARKSPRFAAWLCAKRVVEASKRRKGIEIEPVEPIKWWLDEEPAEPVPELGERKMVIAIDLAKDLGLPPASVSGWGQRGCVYGELRKTVTSDRATGRQLWWLDEDEARTYAALSMREKIRKGRKCVVIRLKDRPHSE